MIHVEYNLQEYFNRAFSLLSKLSLISDKSKHKKSGIKIHRIIQEELMNFTEDEVKYDTELEKNEDLLNGVISYIEKNFGYVDNDPKNLKANEELYNQTKSIANVITNKKLNSKITVNEKIFELLQKIWNYELRSKRIAKHSVDYIEIIENKIIERLNESNNSANPLDLENSISNIGYTYNSLNRYNKGLEYNLKAFEMKKRLFEGDHIEIALSINNIGTSYSHLNDHNKALEYLLKSLEMRQRLYNKDHPDIAKSFNNIGCTYDKLKNYDQALEFKLESLEMCRKLYNGVDHSNLALLLNNVGSAYGKLGNHKEKNRYFRDVVNQLHYW
jgi:tetratricopeptide (TPR) repeat protein